MPSVRFLRDLQLRIVEVVLRDKSMVYDEKCIAIRAGRHYKIEDYNDGPNNTIDLTFPVSSPLRGTVVGISKDDIVLNVDAPIGPTPHQGGCKGCPK